MPEFTYTARNTEGHKVAGSITAETRGEALALLAGRTLFPLEVEGVRGAGQDGRVRRVPPAALAVAYGQLSDLLRSGVPLLKALDVLRNHSHKPALKDVLGHIHRQVEEGSTLAEAMARFDRVFGQMATSMVRAGGEGGFLEDALFHVAQFTQAQDDLKKRTVGAMIYPLVLAVVGTAVVAFLMIFFVPRFDPLFESLRQRGQLPIATEWLLAFSGMLSRWGVWILLTLLAGGWLIRSWLQTDPGRLWCDTWKLRLPLIGSIYLDLAVARFCRVLGTLLGNGVPIVRSLEISGGATANCVLSSSVEAAAENISSGERLAEPLAKSGHFPAPVVEMITVAEESNTLETVLPNIADSLEQTTWRRLDLAVRLLEPIMLLLLASVVLVLVIALLLPVIRMSTTV